MNYKDLILSYQKKHYLLSLMLELTYSCQFKCPFCYNEKNKKGKKLNIIKYEELLKEGKELGALYLTLTGGEPTLNKLFFKICKIANNLNYSIRIKSNGYNWDKNFIKRLKEEVNPFNVDLSIHSLKKDVFEKITNLKGSFESFMKTVQDLKSENVRIRFKFPVNNINEGEIEDIFKFAQNLNIGIDAFAEITPTDEGEIFPLNYIASDAGIKKMYEMIYFIRKNDNFSFISEEEMDKMDLKDEYVCGAGTMTATIDPYGNFYPCVAWRQKLGNLWEKTLKEIWISKEAKKLIELNREAKKRKEKVPLLKEEFFCLGNAYSQFKNPLTIYPECIKIAKIRKSVLNEIRKEKEYERKKEI